MSDVSDEEQPSHVPKAGDILASLEDDDGDFDPSEISYSEREYMRFFEQQSISQQVQYAHLQGIIDHYKHKGAWSSFLMIAVAGMVLFQMFLLCEVGLGRLDFREYEWLLPALLVQNLGQVIGLAVYAVKYLFSDISGQKVE